MEGYGLTMTCLGVKEMKNGVVMLNSGSQLERLYNHLGDKTLGLSVSYFIDGLGEARRTVLWAGVLSLNNREKGSKDQLSLFTS